MIFYKENMRDVFGKTLVELGEKYKKLIVLDADLNTSTRTVYFKEKFPNRFIQCGVAEGNMIGIAAGLAFMGFIPFPCSFASFTIRKGLDQIFMNICYPRLNVKIPGSYVGITATENGPSHNIVEDIAIMRSLPYMRIIAPGDNRELRSAMYKMMEYEGPVYFRVPRIKPPILFSEDYTFEWGKGVILKEGKDISLLSTGMMTGIALKAAEILDKDGINVEVIHFGSIKPIDEELIIKTAEKTGCVVTIENGKITGGFGGIIAEILSKEKPTPVQIMGIKGDVVESASLSDLLKHHKLTPKDIAQEIKKILKN